MYNKQPSVDDLEWILTRSMSTTKAARTSASILPTIQEKSLSPRSSSSSRTILSPTPGNDENVSPNQRLSRRPSTPSSHQRQGKYRFENEEVSLARRLRRIQRRKLFEYIENNRQKQQQQQTRKLMV